MTSLVTSEVVGIVYPTVCYELAQPATAKYEVVYFIC